MPKTKNRQPQRAMPTSAEIAEWWSQDYAWSCECQCLACGRSTAGTERAHIQAVIRGGSNHVSNLHLLCPSCHAESEALEGAAYWSWFTWQRDHAVRNPALLWTPPLDHMAGGKSLRTKQGMQAAKARGQHLGRPLGSKNKPKGTAQHVVPL